MITKETAKQIKERKLVLLDEIVELCKTKPSNIDLDGIKYLTIKLDELVKAEQHLESLL